MRINYKTQNKINNFKNKIFKKKVIVMLCYVKTLKHIKFYLI